MAGPPRPFSKPSLPGKIIAMTSKTTPKHFIDLNEIDATTLRAMIDRARELKAAFKGGAGRVAADAHAGCKDAVIAMVFAKPSTRTRLSFDVAMRRLGGSTMVLNPGDLQLGRGETIADTARVMSRYLDGVVIRNGAHDALLEFADAADIPVINALTNVSHPCQIMADILTFEEHVAPIAGRTVAWVGDGNNVAVSWVHAAERFGFTLKIATPAELLPSSDVLDWAAARNVLQPSGEAARALGLSEAAGRGAQAHGAHGSGEPSGPGEAVTPRGTIVLCDSAEAACAGADAVVTDTWVSMADNDAERRLALLQPFQVSQALMQLAAPHAIFMHCLPAYRGREVVADVIDGPQSVVWDEAENRLHAQMAILEWCLSAGEAF